MKSLHLRPVLLTLVAATGWLPVSCAVFTPQNTSSPETAQNHHVPLSRYVTKHGWKKIKGATEGAYQAGEHTIVFSVGTNYVTVDGKSVNLRGKIYTRGGEIFIPDRFQNRFAYVFEKTRSVPAKKNPRSKWKPSKSSTAYAKYEEPDLTDYKPTALPGKSWTGPVPSFPKKLRLPRTKKWKYIVIHHSSTGSGNARIFHRFHKYRKHWKNGLGYHFVIGNGSNSKNGLVEIGPRWVRQQAGAHAGSNLYNQRGIGICLVGNYQNKQPRGTQMRALIKFTKLLMKKYKIPASRVLPHRVVRRGHTNCPGKCFPWKRFINQLKGKTYVSSKSKNKNKLSFLEQVKQDASFISQSMDRKRRRG